MPRYVGYSRKQKEEIETLKDNSQVILEPTNTTDVSQIVFNYLKTLIDNIPLVNESQGLIDTNQNKLIQSLELRTFAMEEFVSTYLSAFGIKINGSLYVYDGNYQSIVPLFVVYGKNAENLTDWKLLIELTQSTYNSFSGAIKVTYDNGKEISLTLANFNSNRRGEILLPNTRNLTSYNKTFPITISYNSLVTNSIYTLTIDETMFNNLSLPSISYQKASYSFNINTTIETINPNISNTGTVPITFWNVQPQLPEGLIFTNGVITGTPTKLSSNTPYTISLINNWGGVDNTIIYIEVI